jgi:hypothetical protein
MKRPAALFHFALALGATNLMTETSAAEPMPINACRTIPNPGSYRLTQNLNATGDCLVIKADLVTIDLAGFTIQGSFVGVGIVNGAKRELSGIAVRNGSISGFKSGVDLGNNFLNSTSVVEGLRVFDTVVGITAGGMIRGNTILGGDTGIISAFMTIGNHVRGAGTGILTGGLVSGNIVEEGKAGIRVSRASTVIGNEAQHNTDFGISVECPSNLIDNTAVDNGKNLVTNPPNGQGCHIEDNLAP